MSSTSLSIVRNNNSYYLLFLFGSLHWISLKWEWLISVRVKGIILYVRCYITGLCVSNLFTTCSWQLLTMSKLLKYGWLIFVILGKIDLTYDYSVNKLYNMFMAQFWLPCWIISFHLVAWTEKHLPPYSNFVLQNTTCSLIDPFSLVYLKSCKSVKHKRFSNQQPTATLLSHSTISAQTLLIPHIPRRF